MKTFLIYFKHKTHWFLGFAALLFISGYFVGFNFIHLLLLIVSIIGEYTQHKQYNNFLDRQGLTAKQYADKKFVESWIETRQAGLTRYCFIDGGVIQGSILSLLIGAAFFKTGLLGDVSKDLTSMMELIWKSFLLGFMIAYIFNRLRWPNKEKRFAKLTGSYQVINL